MNVRELYTNYMGCKAHIIFEKQPLLPGLVPAEYDERK